MCRHCGSEIKCLEKLRLADLALTNWHGPLVRRRKNRVPRTPKACRKSEIVLNSPDEQFCPPACLDRRSPIWRFEPPQGRKAPKKLLRVYPAQPIDNSRFGRENPRKSNPQNQGFSQRNDEGPRKSKSTPQPALSERLIIITFYCRNYISKVSHVALRTAARRIAA
jgi:hypothetical protein